MSATANGLQRFRKAHPCPICGGGDDLPRGKGQRCSGFLSSDGRFAYCTREEHAGQAQQEQTDPPSWRHILEGACRCGLTHAEARDVSLATYDYRDADGTLLFQVVRQAGKRFLQRRPDGSGGWIWDLQGITRVLYRLPELLVAVQGDDSIWVCEGEKDVAALERAGAAATCNPGGAGKWRPEYADVLSPAAEVIIIADKDEPGMHHARDVLRSLPTGLGRIALPAAGKDAADHLAAGLGLEDFIPLLEVGLNGDGPDLAPEEPPHTWTPIDLIGTAAAPPEPPVISGLVYPGRRHLFSGEPESLKSWAAMVLCAEQIHAGANCAYIDFEMGGRETLARLRDLGLADAALQAQFIYIEPAEPFWNAAIRDDTDLLLLERQPTLIIIDAFTGALQTHSLDPNKSVDIELFYRGVIDPLRARGAAVVVLDHLPKDPANRGKFAIGSERKVGAAEVHLGFEAAVPFGRGRAGLAKTTTHKDRPGHLPRPKAAELELASSPTNGRITWKLVQEPTPKAPDAPFRPTHLMEKASRWLEAQREPVPLKNAEEEITGRRGFVRKALEQLCSEGYALEERGTRGARLFTTRKQYREEHDPLLEEPSHDPENHLAPPRPDLARGEVKSDLATSPPPVRGEVAQGGEVKAPISGDLAPDEEPGISDPDADIPF